MEKGIVVLTKLFCVCCNSCFSDTHLQVVVTHRAMTQMMVHTFAKALQTGGVRSAAGVRTWRRFDQQAAGAGDVLAGALAGLFLQRHESAEP